MAPQSVWTVFVNSKSLDPAAIRTPDLSVRTQLLYRKTIAGRNTAMRRITTSGQRRTANATVVRIFGGKLLARANFNKDETSLFWKRTHERTFIEKEVKSMSGFKVCVSTLYDVRTTTKSPNDTFLRKYARREATHGSSRYLH